MAAERLEPLTDSACLILASMELNFFYKILYKKAQGKLFSTDIKIF